MNLRPLLLSLLLASPIAALAGENTVWIHNDKLDLRVPSEWTIIAHKPAGNRTLIAFQLPGNPAEEGTEESTNLAVSTFNLHDTESMLAFTTPLIEEQEGAENSSIGPWIVREWLGKQGKTPYKIADGRVTHAPISAGIHVRLAWPSTEANPKDYDTRMMELFRKLLKELEERHKIKPGEAPGDKKADSPQPGEAR
jgi:hypothetical protein